ncbi:MAG: sxtJ [Symploca sp. SIO1B1]|nr:sxtJ [Symploca sp. SIO1B1]
MVAVLELGKIKNSKKELRQFGMTLGTIIPLLFGLILPWLWGYQFPLFPWIIGSLLWIVALTFPLSLQLLYRIWMKIATIMAFVNSSIILGIIFFVVVTPMGFIMTLVQYDPLRRKKTFNQETYRINSQVKKRETMEKPY